MWKMFNFFDRFKLLMWPFSLLNSHVTILTPPRPRMFCLFVLAFPCEAIKINFTFSDFSLQRAQTEFFFLPAETEKSHKFNSSFSYLFYSTQKWKKDPKEYEEKCSNNWQKIENVMKRDQFQKCHFYVAWHLFNINVHKFISLLYCVNLQDQSFNGILLVWYLNKFCCKRHSVDCCILVCT